MNNNLSTSRIFSVGKWIWVTFQVEGKHCYPAAATDPKLATGDWDDVSFLANEHRHKFHFKVSINVTHNDREIEFIQFQRFLKRLYSEKELDFNNKSCEMLADELYWKIIKRYGDRRLVKIEVSEDGENGCLMEYIPKN